MKRQTEPQGVVSLWDIAPLDIDPFRLPIQYALPLQGRLNILLKAKNQFVLGSRSILIQKTIMHRPVWQTRLSINDFQGVSLRITVLNPQNNSVAISINLHHEILEYCIPLHLAFDTDVSGARLQTWSRILGLPILLPTAEGTWRKPIKTLGKLKIKPPFSRDQSFHLQSRKSFLSHFRETGKIDSSKKITGHEIISWD